MTALCALMLVDAGELDLDAAVSRYWPEFAAGGKEGRVLLRHLLGHTAGLPGLVRADDRRGPLRLGEGHRPAGRPGAVVGAGHGVRATTPSPRGTSSARSIRRVTGQSIGAFFREQVAGPLGADFHIGLDPAEFGRVSNVVPPPPGPTSSVRSSDGRLRTLAQPAARRPTTSWTDAVAAGRDPGRQRARQRPLGGHRAVRRRQRGRGGRRPAAVGGRLRPDPRRAVLRHRPGARRAHPFRHRVTGCPRRRCRS